MRREKYSMQSAMFSTAHTHSTDIGSFTPISGDVYFAVLLRNVNIHDLFVESNCSPDSAGNGYPKFQSRDKFCN